MKEWLEKAAGVFAGNALLNYIWELCMSVSVIILFLLLLRPLFKRLPRTGMYLLWVLVVFRILLPVPITGIYNLLPEQVESAIFQNAQNLSPVQIQDRLESERGELSGKGNHLHPLKKETTTGTKEILHSEDPEIAKKTIGETGTDTEPETWQSVIPMDAVLCMVWLAGVLACLIYVICSLAANYRMFRHTIQIADDIYRHPFACSSFVGGIISPKIYIPEGVEGEDLECVLCHERVHIKRHDYRMKPVAFLAFSILWFNPLVWIAFRLMMKDMEISCDEAVLGRLGEAARKRYSYLLLAMASGENSVLGANTAFGAGIVNERIHHVMKYKKPSKRTMTVAVVMVLLCGCGISSTPERTAEKSAVETKSDNLVYGEEVVLEKYQDTPDIGLEERKNISWDKLFCDSEGKWVNFGYMYQTLENIKKDPVKLVHQDGVWRAEKIKWVENLEKVQKRKEHLDDKFYEDNLHLYDMFYGGDGCLYLCCSRTSMSYEIYNTDPDRYSENFYDIDQLLYRVNEETGEVSMVEVPVVKGREVYDDTENCPENLVLTNCYAVLANGDYVVRTGNIFAVYNGMTGEKRKDIDCASPGQAGEVFAGEDFICWYELNQKTKRIEIRVCDASGNESYVLDTQEKVEYSKDEGYSDYSFALGVKENTIIAATSKGIFEAEYGEDELHTVIDTEKDNLYYLGSDSYVSMGRVYKGADGKYFLQNWMKNGGKSVSCFYAPMGNQESTKKP